MSNLILNITEFITEGKFGFVDLGDTKEYIEDNLSSPEDWLSGKSKESSAVWRYGNFEFHFDKDNTLVGIFNDYVPNVEGGEFITICDWWILKKENKSPSLIETIDELNRLKLDFKKSTNNVDIVTLNLSNKVYLVFENRSETINLHEDAYSLVVIGKQE